MCIRDSNEGNVVDGDQVIALCAKYMTSVGTLKKDTAVVTVMSNMGFFKFCDALVLWQRKRDPQKPAESRLLV